MKFKVNQSADASGTSLQGYLKASCASLTKAFGQPGESDGCKVSTEWKFIGEDGSVVTLYDYKDTSLYDESLPSVEDFRALPSYDWHIGAKNGTDRAYLGESRAKGTVEPFKLWLQTQI